MTGRFITFEGCEGVGKTTQVARAAGWLRARGLEVVVTREPGGTPRAEALRKLLLERDGEPMPEACELLLMFAARSSHLDNLVRPALARGAWVVCDRFTDATYAYQGGGHGVSRAFIASLETFVHADCRPDLTILFDVPLAVSRARLARAEANGRALDKFESERQDFFARVRVAYLERAAAEPQRVRVVDSSRPVDDVRVELAALLAALGQ